MGVVAEFNVEVQEGITIHHYDKLMQKFKEWIEFKRDAKIMSLLENKSIKFDIEKIHTSPHTTIFGYVGKEKNIESTIEYTGFIITDMTFILKSNVIKSLNLKIKTIDKNLENLIENFPDIKYKIKQHIENNSVLYFYIDSSDPVEKTKPS